MKFIENSFQLIIKHDWLYSEFLCIIIIQLILMINSLLTYY